MSQESFPMIAKTFQGLEDVLATELTQLGADQIEKGRRMVSFVGDKTMLYKANFWLRTALRILKPIAVFDASDADELYAQSKEVPWENWLSTEMTFAVDAVVMDDAWRNSLYVSYRVKDAIVDRLTQLKGKRPSVSVSNPDLRINAHIAAGKCTLSLDSSGDSLHRRGYRQEAVEAPLNEVLAAGIIMMTGWNGECDFIDPMCGSGTFAIEAGLMATGTPPGIFRKEFAFERWLDFDEDLMQMIYDDESGEKEFKHHIYAYDINLRACEITANNIKATHLTPYISIEKRAMEDFVAPKEKAIMVTNPPYGERISAPDIIGLYTAIGERLKHAFTGCEAWILAYKKECIDAIGLKPSQKIHLLNGALPCELRQYSIFEGKHKEMKSQMKSSDKPYYAKQGFKPNNNRSGFKKDNSKSDFKTGSKPYKPFNRRDKR